MSKRSCRAEVQVRDVPVECSEEVIWAVIRTATRERTTLSRVMGKWLERAIAEGWDKENDDVRS